MGARPATTPARCRPTVYSSARNSCKLRTNAAWESSCASPSRMTPGCTFKFRSRRVASGTRYSTHQPLAWHPSSSTEVLCNNVGLHAALHQTPDVAPPARVFRQRFTATQPCTHVRGALLTKGPDSSFAEAHRGFSYEPIHTEDEVKDQEDEVEDGTDKSKSAKRGSKRDQTHKHMTHGWYDSHKHLEPMSCETLS